MLALAGAPAQAPAAAPQPQPSAVDYQVGPGDLLSIHVSGLQGV